jgi:hypothetical protein
MMQQFVLTLRPLIEGRLGDECSGWGKGIDGEVEVISVLGGVDAVS